MFILCVGRLYVGWLKNANLKTSENVKSRWSAKSYTRENNHFYSSCKNGCLWVNILRRWKRFNCGEEQRKPTKLHGGVKPKHYAGRSFGMQWTRVPRGLYYFDNCSPVWSNFAANHHKSLQILHNKLARVLLHADIRTPIDKMVEELNWLNTWITCCNI